MYTHTASFYDRIYSFKDYAAEVRRLREIVQQRLTSGGRTLLDVACGTGLHLALLRDRFEVEGLDLAADMLEIARERNPGVQFHRGDMSDFDLGRTYDVVTCLFSSIGYVQTLERLGRAVRCMARHLRPGGLLLVEPWFTPEAWHPGTVHGIFLDDPELKIARVNSSFADGRRSWFDLHYLIGTPAGTEHFVEHHELGLFTVEEMRQAMVDAGLEVEHDPEGLSGRGLYIARPASAS